MRIVYYLPGPMSRGPLGPEELVRRGAYLTQAAFQSTELEVRESDVGPSSIESSAEEYLSIPATLEAAPCLEAEGFDAMIIGCFGDPGLAPARELVDIPVIGPGQASALAAVQVGQRFAIITVVDEVVPAIRRQMRSYGLEGLVSDIRAVDVPVLELRERADEVLGTLELEAHAALQTGADTLILGCMTMGFLDVARALQDRIGVPVINPVLASLKAAESAISIGLCSSRQAYPRPRKTIDSLVT